MILPILIYLAVPFFSGFILLILLNPKGRRALCFASGLIFGLGIQSVLCFLWFLIQGPVDQFWIATGLFPAVLIPFWIRNWRNSPVSPALQTVPVVRSFTEKILAILIWPVLLAAVCTFLSYSISNPHGQWDAWATWNLRARYFFRLGNDWKESFASFVPSSNADYPLLLPLSIVQGWFLLENESQLIPVIYALIMTFGTVAILSAAIREIRGRTAAELAVFILLGTTLFIERGASQQADVTVSCFYLLAVVFLIYGFEKLQNRKSSMFLSGLAAGFGAWTKNEGAVFLLSISLMTFWSAYRTRTARTFLPFGYLLLGSLPGVLSLLAFKIFLSPPGYVLAQGYGPLIQGLMDPARLFYIWKEFMIRLTLFGSGKIPMVPIIVIYGILLKTRSRKDISAAFCAIQTVILTMAGYLLFYQITPFEYRWQISQSMDRLLMHCWPSFLFLFFYCVRTPQEKKAQMSQ